MYTHLIQPNELMQQRKTSWLVFDVRHDLGNAEAGKQAYLKGHIPGALFLNNDTQLAGVCTGKNGRHPLPDREEFEALMRTQGLTSRSQVVIYDAGNSMFAARLWWLLRWLGHEAVAILDGGWQAWLQAGGEQELVERQPRLTEAQVVQSFKASTKAAMPTVDVQQVLENLALQEKLVVDARAAERYRGDIEPMDPKAGHIPHAINRPISANTDLNGRFKPAAVLAEEFAQLLGTHKPEHIVHQCGSGITACHNLFAMEVAGLRGSSLYPGSWSEWVSDDTRPIAVGDKAE